MSAAELTTIRTKGKVLVLRGPVSVNPASPGEVHSPQHVVQDQYLTFLPHKGQRVEVQASELSKEFERHRRRDVGAAESLLRSVRSLARQYHMNDFSAIAVPRSDALDLHLTMASAIAAVSNHSTVAVHVLDDDGSWVSYPA